MSVIPSRLIDIDTLLWSQANKNDLPSLPSLSRPIREGAAATLRRLFFFPVFYSLLHRFATNQNLKVVLFQQRDSKYENFFGGTNNSLPWQLWCHSLVCWSLLICVCVIMQL